MRAGVVLAAALSLSLAACGSTASTKPVTVSTDPASLGPILIAEDSVAIAEYCLHAVGATVGRQPLPTAKQTLFLRRALRSLQTAAQTRPNQIYRGAPLRVQVLKLARILETGRCESNGAGMLRKLAQSMR